ncbi:hypothetical protein ABF87_12365 [Nitrosomonas sp. JL21]|nr:hypothetical protein [Nitrosomonas sp. JL21]
MAEIEFSVESGLEFLIQIKKSEIESKAYSKRNGTYNSMIAQYFFSRYRHLWGNSRELSNFVKFEFTLQLFLS